jgi:hypothetical protein
MTLLTSSAVLSSLHSLRSSCRHLSNICDILKPHLSLISIVEVNCESAFKTAHGSNSGGT